MASNFPANEAKPFAQIGALNGVWERARRLFRIQSGQAVPPGITPVWIAGDSRECCGQAESYRRFAVSISVLVPIGNALKILATAPVVIERIRWTTSGGVPLWYAASPAQTVALDALATFNAVTSATATWRDSPDGSVPPVSFVNSAAAAGNVLAAYPGSAGGTSFAEIPDMLLPTGASVQCHCPTTAATITCYMMGYLRGSA